VPDLDAVDEIGNPGVEPAPISGQRRDVDVVRIGKAAVDDRRPVYAV
jgi:hypothetical protein